LSFQILEKKMLKKFLSCTLIILVQMICVGPIYAQSATLKEDASIQKFKREIGKLNTNGKNIARVKLHNGTTLKGYISQANADNFVITDKQGQKNTVVYTDVSGVKKGSGLSNTSKVLIVSGVAVGVAVTVLAISFARIGRGFRGGIGGY
jgi:sRNA-binding regulator protein Hfq